MSGTFEGVGTLQFSPDNKYGQIFSGVKTVNNGTTTMFEFNTEGYYLVGHFCFSDGEGWSSGQYLLSKVFFNDVVVLQIYNVPNTAYNDHNDLVPMPFMIPPYTTVKATMTSNIDNDHDLTAYFTGEVKGTIEQIDLEAIRDGSKWADQ